MNTAYLSQIRSQSCYPAFRKFVDIATALMFLLSAILVFAGFMQGEQYAVVGGIVGAVFIVLVAIVAKEVSLMLVDIADATIDSAGRGTNLQPAEVSSISSTNQSDVCL
jgi:hypothetical protein